MKTLLPEVLNRAKAYAEADSDMLVELYSISDERLLWASPSHKTILGYDPQDLIGIHWKEIVYTKDHAHKSIMLEDAKLTGQSLVIGFNIVQKSGDLRYVKVVDDLYDDEESEEKYVICRTTQVGEPQGKRP